MGYICTNNWMNKLICQSFVDCGTSPYEDAGTCDREGTTCTTPKVVGGVEAREHELPYQVSFQTEFLSLQQAFFTLVCSRLQQIF